MGPTNAETGEVVRFGIRADYAGNKPSVIVRTSAGKQFEIVAPATSLQGCSRGAKIKLLRKVNRLEVAPIGCR
jgi:hypothetical protein